jgi:hypothetical protein
MQWATVNRSGAEKAYVVVTEKGTQELIPGTVCEYTITATAAEQGVEVGIVDVVVNATTGIAAPIAGVVDSTIGTSDVGRLQVHGPCTVRVSTTIATGRLAVASSQAIAPTGVAIADVLTTTTTAAYARAAIGVVLADTNATQHVVQLDVI